MKKPPASLRPEVAEMISHCAEWVAQHGPSFEKTLKAKNASNPAFSFLQQPASLEAKYYRRCLEHERGQRIVNMSKQALPPQIPAVSHRKQHHGAAVGTRFAGVGKSVCARGGTGRRTGGNGAGDKRAGLSRTNSTTRQRVHRSIRPRFEQKSANAALTDTFHVIKHEVGYGNDTGSGARGWHLGAAVNGIDSIYRRFRCGWSGSK